MSPRITLDHNTDATQPITLGEVTQVFEGLKEQGVSLSCLKRVMENIY